MVKRFGSIRQSTIAKFRRFQAWALETFIGPKFAKLAMEFFTEVAVLVFVFPVLDTVIQFGRRKLSWQLAGVSIGVAVVCMVLAAIMARVEKG